MAFGLLLSFWLKIYSDKYSGGVVFLAFGKVRCGDMALALVGAGPGGAIPDLVGASHPPLDGGAITGHGGAALCLYAGLTQQQAVQFETMGQVEAPIGRGGQAYWALKTTGGSCGPKCCQCAPGDGACGCCVEAGDGDACGLAAVGADGSPLLVIVAYKPTYNWGAPCGDYGLLHLLRRWCPSSLAKFVYNSNNLYSDKWPL